MIPSVFAVQMDQYPFSQKPFTDVAVSHQFYDAIEHLRTNNAVKGYLDGRFRPNNRITRAEFVSLITNPFFFASQRSSDCLATYNSQTAGQATQVFFSDVPTDAPYAQDLCETVKHDIIHGYPDGTFKPTAYISFAEASKIIGRIMEIDTRRDKVDDIRWYTAYVQRLGEKSAIPRSINSLTKKLTRGEMAEILYRLKTDNTSKASMHIEDYAW